MSKPSVRPYRDAGDLRKMQALLSAAYEQTDLRIGDLAWIVRAHTHRELGLDIRIWEDGDAVAGWTFFQSSGSFSVFAAPGTVTDALVDEMLATVEGMAREAIAAGDPLNKLCTYGIVPGRSPLDHALASGLERNGFRCEETDGGVLTIDPATLDEPSVPPGYLLAIVDTPRRIIGRVEAHRAAFAPSEVTRGMYERVRRNWPYRQELDQIVETESGEVVAFCTAWIDEENAAGLLEPVGVHPNHRRRGLAGAACRAALIALRNAGARTVQVAFTTSEARALYESLGFSLAYAEFHYTKTALA
jgi:predicted N-acetyltransferase YhbS